MALEKNNSTLQGEYFCFVMETKVCSIGIAFILVFSCYHIELQIH